MLKKVMMLAVAAAALAAFVAPTTASAKWQHNHANLAQNAHIQIHGKAKFTGQTGGVECEVTATGQLTAGTTTGHIQAFHVDQTGTKTVTEVCSPFGFLGEVCDDVHSVTTEGFPWDVNAISTTTLEVKTGTIQNHLSKKSFLCPGTVQLTPGIVHINTDSDTFGQGQLSGHLQAHPGGTVVVSGQGTVTPAGTYGVL